jgi:hypothetical protein
MALFGDQLDNIMNRIRHLDREAAQRLQQQLIQAHNEFVALGQACGLHFAVDVQRNHGAAVLQEGPIDDPVPEGDDDDPMSIDELDDASDSDDDESDSDDDESDSDDDESDSDVPPPLISGSDSGGDDDETDGDEVP